MPRRCAPRNDSFWEAVRCVSCGGVRAPRPTGAGHGVRCRRGVGEIGEAPPVAGEANRFRGSAPIGGHDSGRESAGTTVGNRRPLHGGWGCGTGGRGRTPPLRRASCAVGGTERTDCHVAALLAMTVFGRRCGAWILRIATPVCAPVRNDKVGGAAYAGRRGNRRSAAGGGRSEAVSRKCPDWRPRQWVEIGWHDGGQSPPPTET